jgi:hypothetical protein
MHICPKCQSTRIVGPTYIKSGYGQESLRYDCARCGYRHEEPTADADTQSSERLGWIEGLLS